MGVGFIQLITTGTETGIFNNEPQISFFKIYYRRHTNFFVNNYEINGNYVKNQGKLSFVIPKNGDFLNKTYLKINYNEYYTELFKKYDTLANTFNTNILDFYDSFSIKTNSYTIDMIKDIKITKVRFLYKNVNYLTIFCDNFRNEIECLDLLKSIKGINLQADDTDIFYNINEYYKYYSFNYRTDSVDFEINDFAKYLINQIDYNKLQILRIDIQNYNLSISIRYDLLIEVKFKEIIKYLLNVINVNNDYLEMKIQKYTVYMKITYNDNNNALFTSFNELFDVNFLNTDEVLIKIIDNKIKAGSYLIKQENIEIVKKIFFNINKEETTYYDIFNSKKTTLFTVYKLKTDPFFGNFIPNDFNESIIQNETQLITTSNLSIVKLATNL
jgi:hypothetical protein